MALDTFSPNLRISLPGTGNQAGTWGLTTNTNLGGILENAISGYTTLTFSSANITLSITDGVPSTAGNMSIECVGTLGGANTFLYLPQNKKLYFIYNNTSGGPPLPLNVQVTGGTNTVTVPAGTRTLIVCNGTDVVYAQTYFTGTLVGSLTGNVVGNVNGNVTGNVTGNLTGNVTGNVSGTASALSPGRSINGVLFNGTQDITIGAIGGSDAGSLTGTTLAANVVNSSLKTVGTLTNGQVPVNLLTGTFTAGNNGLSTVALSGSASDLSTGTLPVGRLSGSYNINANTATQASVASSVPASGITAAGTPNSSTFLRGDQTWATPTGSWSTGTFTATLTGYGSNPSGTINYVTNGSLVIMWAASAITGTSNSAFLSITNIPAGLRLSTAATIYSPCVMTSGSETPGYVLVTNSSTFNCNLIYVSSVAAPVSITSGNFTNSSTKGLPAGWQIMYYLF